MHAIAQFDDRVSDVSNVVLIERDSSSLKV